MRLLRAWKGGRWIRMGGLGLSHLADGQPQFFEAVRELLSDLGPDLFERSEFHVALDAFDPLIPSLVGDSLFCVEKRLLVREVEVPVDRVSALGLAFFVDALQRRAQPDIRWNAFHYPTVLSGQAVFESGCGLLSEQLNLVPCENDVDDRCDIRKGLD